MRLTYKGRHSDGVRHFVEVTRGMWWWKTVELYVGALYLWQRLPTGAKLDDRQLAYDLCVFTVNRNIVEP